MGPRNSSFVRIHLIGIPPNRVRVTIPAVTPTPAGSAVLGEGGQAVHLSAFAKPCVRPSCIPPGRARPTPADEADSAASDTGAASLAGLHSGTELMCFLGLWPIIGGICWRTRLIKRPMLNSIRFMNGRAAAS